MNANVCRGSYLVAILAALLACKATDKKQPAPAASAAAPAPAPASAAAAPAGTGAKTNFSAPKDAKGVDLAKLLGTKADGWTIPAFAKLKEDMTPAEAGKIIPGAEKIDSYGFSEVKKSDVKGVATYKFSYLDEGGKKALKFATIEFDPKLTDEPFWVALASHLKEKLNSEFTDNGDHHINWVGPGMNLWSLSKGITHEGYELQIALSK
jgi:hypothetical protein